MTTIGGDREYLDHDTEFVRPAFVQVFPLLVAG